MSDTLQKTESHRSIAGTTNNAANPKKSNEGTDERTTPTEQQEETNTEEDEYERVLKYRDPTYFPDGGARAWLVLMGGFFVTVTTWGMTSSFGVFTAYYKKDLLSHNSSFQVGWINSVQTAFIFYGGTMSGKLFDAGYFYHLEITGMLLTFVSFILVAECTEYYQVLLSQGVGMGVGMGMLFGPSLACTGAYFLKYRPLAMSICTAGSGLGGVIFPIIANNLLYNVGFKWTIRILAFVELALFGIIAAVMRDRIPRAVRQQNLAKSHVGTGFFALNSWLDVSVFRDPVFMLFAIAMGCCFLSQYPPYAYLQSFALSLHAPEHLTKYIVSLLNGLGFFGRLSCYFIARAVGPINSTVLVTLFAGITLFSWAAVTNEGGLIAFTIFYGFLSGICGAFPPFVVPQLNPDIGRLGVRFGMVFILLGTSVLISIPVGGLVLGHDYDRFTHLAYFCGGCMIASSVILMCCRLARAGVTVAKV